jgi:pimeloyl-ACP methyl ester carboxylesterase
LAEFAALPVIGRLAAGVVPSVDRRPLITDQRFAGSAHGRARSAHCLRLRAPADRSRLRPGVRAAVEALAAASRSPTAFNRRSVRYDGPVSAIWGDRDGIIPASHANGLTASLPQSDVHIWAGMGHHPQRERPRRLAQFLRTQRPIGTLGLVP